MTENDNFFNDGPSSKLDFFSKSQGRILLDAKRLKNAEYMAPMIPLPQTRHLLLGTTARTSTPIQNKQTKATRGNGRRRLSSSSPSVMSPLSPKHAYMLPDNTLLYSPVDHQTHRHPPTTRLLHSTLPSGSTARNSMIPRADADVSGAMECINLTFARHKEILNENEKLSLLYAQNSRELKDYKERFDSTMKDLQMANAELGQVRPSLASAREDLAARDTEISSLHSQLSELRQQHIATTEDDRRSKEELFQRTSENDRMRDAVDLTKKGIARIAKAHAELGQEHSDLKRQYDALQRQLQEMTREVQDIKRLANNGLAALDPMLDDDSTLARATDTRKILNELQQDLTDSHQVTDMLRNKLLIHVSQLAEAQGRVRELETEKRGSLSELLSAREDEKRNFSTLLDVDPRKEKHVAELSERLVTRERETMDVLANCASNEVALKAALTELENCKKACIGHSAELNAARTMKEENISKLLAFQDVINARDKEIAFLKSELKALNESKAELRVLLVDVKRQLVEKEIELKESDRSAGLQLKIEELIKQNAVFNTALEETRAVLRLSQASEKELIERFREVDNLNAGLLASNKHQQSTLSKAQDAESEIKKRLEVQSANLFQVKEECVALKERLEKHVALETEKEKRAVFAEYATSSAFSQLEAVTKNIQELNSQIAALENELAAAKEAAIQATTLKSLKSDEQVKRLQEKVLNLERFAADAAQQADTLMARYSEGRLTNIEKDLVRHLMREAQDLHEEDVVLKDNELRRRERTIDALKARVAELQAMVARHLREKGQNTQLDASGRSMLDIRAWLPSSDGVEPETSLTDRPEATRLATVALETSHFSTEPPAPVKSADHRLPDTEEDPEDDTPLTQLTLLSEEEKDTEVKVGGKRIRASSPPVPEESARSKRRTLNSTAAGNAQAEASAPALPIAARRRAVDAASKTKQKKRK